MSTIDYQNQLPKKRMGAGALIFNQHNELLLVEPSYKPTWEIPGGVVEQNESPRTCCLREVKEELGLDINVGRLLVIDYNDATEQKLESLMFIFDGGFLTKEMILSIRLQREELLSYRFFKKGSLPQNMTPSLRKRILVAWEMSESNLAGDAYRENGETL